MRSIDPGARIAGHAFRDPALLAQALTHRSAGAPHNERLEFLGDALVGLIVAEVLYLRWPRADEGAMTRARAELVRESSLARIARDLELGARITLGPGEMKSGGHRRDSILSDALEAVVGAIYLDAGFEACRSAVLPWFEPQVAALPAGGFGKDPKTRLQEWLQGRQRPLPSYELVSESGEEHARIFLVRCLLTEPALEAEGSGSSRRAAEQDAATAILSQLESAKP
ncbi:MULTISPECIES: ribonuclease III [unclassified Luteimonas]|uniref:ribonuclease III n=1 Tax=unclassified Luteimonas TaxID=2629088 RepID=UPI0018F0FE73|nr:ribonuclease III [Luteimonas sp. MC1750]MBJ6979564.1 ribonuclease III [Luteimonas sp. MC1895]MBJ6983150.1 ribonuclease III [Luteimonas sp. MC1750]QQO05144.1 ribonuclease III [Luteimonas sp. MC1750]